MSAPLPVWAEQMKRRYLRGEAAQFILYGNIHDQVLYNGKLWPLDGFLCDVLFASKQTVVRYNVSGGIRFSKRPTLFPLAEELLVARGRDKVMPILERLLESQEHLALVLDYAETLVPAADVAMYSDADRATLIALHRWASLPSLESADNLVVLMTENVSDLHPRLVNNPLIAAIAVPIPGPAEREALVEYLAPALESAARARLAEITAGLKAVQMRSILRPDDSDDDIDRRKKFITELLGQEANAARVNGLARITKGMSLEEVRELVAPSKSVPLSGQRSALSVDIENVVARQKREIIERECSGLLSFVESSHGFEAVGGMDEVKRELSLVAQAIKGGERERVPMGFLFVGPMGTGKTFVAEAFAKASGLTAVKFGSFRSKWVGATEANLERILAVLKAMGQVIVFIDEVDRAMAGNDGSGDGGTESRVIARLKEFMSDSTNRGRILFVLMTNRPDRLDTDIKRTGRLDRKIPFFYAQTATEVEPILSAIAARHHLNLSWSDALQHLLSKLINYSSADLEGVVLLAASYAASRVSESTVTLSDEDWQLAVNDYLPSRDTAMLEFMDLLAVYEASNRRLLPAKYAALSPEELSDRLQAARLKVGNRR